MEATCIMRKHVRACVDMSADVHVHAWVYTCRDKWKSEVYVQHLPQLFSVLLETVTHWGWSSPIWLDWPATKTLESLLSPALQHWDIGPCHHAQLGVQILKTEIRSSCFYVYFSDSHFTFLGGHSFGPHLQKPFQHLMLWIIALLHEMLLLQHTSLPHLLLCVSLKQTPLAPVQLTTWPSSTKCWRLLFNVLIVRMASTGWFYSPSQFKEKSQVSSSTIPLTAIIPIYMPLIAIIP